MNCQQIHKKLPTFLDADLGRIERKIVENHLKSCSVCQAELEKYQTVSDLTKSAIQVAEDKNTPVSIWETLQYRLPKTESARKTKSNSFDVKTWKRWTPALVGVATLLIFSLLLNPEKQPFISPQMSESPMTEVPVVEEVFQDDVTVMTFETSDPTIKIVWFFYDSKKQSKSNGGVS